MKLSRCSRPRQTIDHATRQRTARKRAGLLAHVGRHEFDPRGFEVIEGEPIVYWWTKEFLKRYANAPKLGATQHRAAWPLNAEQYSMATKSLGGQIN